MLFQIFRNAQVFNSSPPALSQIQSYSYLKFHHYVSATPKLMRAYQRKALVDKCPEAKKIRVVLDNLNTHTTTALYQAFPPETRKERSPPN